MSVSLCRISVDNIITLFHSYNILLEDWSPSRGNIHQHLNFSLLALLRWQQRWAKASRNIEMLHAVLTIHIRTCFFACLIALQHPVSFILEIAFGPHHFLPISSSLIIIRRWEPFLKSSPSHSKHLFWLCYDRELIYDLLKLTMSFISFLLILLFSFGS